MGKLSLFSLLSLVAIGEFCTAQAPLPPLYNLADFGKFCSPGSILTPTLCKQYDRTVKCSKVFQGVCICNLETDAEFDEDEQACVGLVGTVCLMEATSWGRKICTKNADCFVEDQNFVEGHTIGVCRCLDGWIAVNKTCVPITDYTGIPATLRPTTTRKPLVTAQPTPTTVDPTSRTTAKEDKDNGATWAQIANGLIAITTVFNLVGQKLL